MQRTHTASRAHACARQQSEQVNTARPRQSIPAIPADQYCRYEIIFVLFSRASRATSSSAGVRRQSAHHGAEPYRLWEHIGKRRFVAHWASMAAVVGGATSTEYILKVHETKNYRG
ncbi:hypothetical protein ANCDUO_03554 [Ancylostoma duodenale]|uniref:Uncharacterized protein n=1 Tax=Ancylostoma duodenale TaxID=51022 RepID=A0A0C2D8Q8_9BILA|nr:hypothetical protein ANCDUO_03554 [Ancylostoma duodenale]